MVPDFHKLVTLDVHLLCLLKWGTHDRFSGGRCELKSTLWRERSVEKSVI